jgi:hypothetical protein
MVVPLGFFIVDLTQGIKGRFFSLANRCFWVEQHLKKILSVNKSKVDTLPFWER